VTILAAPDFASRYGEPPRARGEAPGRVNLIGDHTDYNDGFVLPTAIPQTTTVEAGFGRDSHEAYSASLDRYVRFTDSGDLPDFARYVGGCLRVLAEEGIKVPPLRLWISSTVPVGAGLSSSAALEIATLRAVSQLLGFEIDPVEQAKLGQRAEIEYAHVHVGIMDQMASALATVDRMLFLDTMTLAYQLLPLPAGSEMLVVDSGASRELSASAYNTRRLECRKAAELLGVSSLREVTDPSLTARLPSPLRERARHVITENRRVQEAAHATAPEFGLLMNASHASLRDDYQVTTPALDELAAFLRDQAGVFGARMTGAGFGGSCVALAAAGQGHVVAARVNSEKKGRPWRPVVPMQPA
jgi:galactokinase